MRRALPETAWLDSLYRESSADLLAFLRRRCKTPEAAADCLAEAYLVAWRKRTERPPDDELRPWLFGIARNVALRGHQHDGQLASATKALAQSISSAIEPPDDPTDELRGMLREPLAQLSQLDQEIITMLSWDSLKPAEIAKVLGISANVVRVRAHRARARLRVELADLADTPDTTATALSRSRS
jgi:RNA polymerase sigma factor (sigma-70 family)